MDDFDEELVGAKVEDEVAEEPEASGKKTKIEWIEFDRFEIKCGPTAHSTNLTSTNEKADSQTGGAMII